MRFCTHNNSSIPQKCGPPALAAAHFAHTITRPRVYHYQTHSSPNRTDSFRQEVQVSDEVSFGIPDPHGGQRLRPNLA